MVRLPCVVFNQYKTEYLYQQSQERGKHVNHCVSTRNGIWAPKKVSEAISTRKCFHKHYLSGSNRYLGTASNRFTVNIKFNPPVRNINGHILGRAKAAALWITSQFVSWQPQQWRHANVTGSAQNPFLAEK